MSTKNFKPTKDEGILNRDIGRGYEPVHPGSILRDSYLDAHDVTIAKFAEIIGVDKAFVSRLVNEKVGVSPLMALRLSKALRTSVELWINLQRNYDLYKASRSTDLSNVKDFYTTTNSPYSAMVLRDQSNPKQN